MGFIKKIISTGATPNLSNEEINRIKLTNGGALITGLASVITSVLILLIELITTGSIEATLKTVLVMISVGVISISIIGLDKLEFYFAARFTIMLLWWIALTGLCIVYAGSIPISLYFLGIILLPKGIFSKKIQAYFATMITAILFLGMTAYSFFHEPLIETSANLLFYRYMLHSFMAVTAIVSISFYYRWQNDKYETTLANEAKALQESEQTFRKLVEESSDAILLINNNGNFVECNQATLNLLKMTREEFFQSSHSKISPECQPDGMNSIKTMDKMMEFALEKGLHRFDWTYIDRNGDEFIVEVSLMTIMFKGHPLLYTSWHDITQRIKTENELKQANMAKDKFFSIIAHDLKGPIGNIANLLSYIDLNEINPELMRSIQSAAKNTYELTEDLLTWARAQKGHIDIEQTNFNICQYCKDVISNLEFSARKKNIQLVTKDKGDNFYVYADVPSINTVLRNLVSNAIKFTNDGGTVTLSASLVNDKVKIMVKDTGLGIAPDKLSQLFKVGSNISSPGTNNETGTGLGLILCKEFVELNGGEIGVESELEKGSTFWFTLPTGTAIDEKNTLNFFKEKHLETLIVEDNYLNLQNTINELSTLKIKYDIARDGEEAITKGTNREYDFILMDIDLPKVNGIGANKAIRKKHPNAIIISLSSYSKNEILDKDENVRFEAFLRKPLSTDNLVYTLEKVIPTD